MYLYGDPCASAARLKDKKRRRQRETERQQTHTDALEMLGDVSFKEGSSARSSRRSSSVDSSASILFVTTVPLQMTQSYTRKEKEAKEKKEKEIHTKKAREREREREH